MKSIAHSLQIFWKVYKEASRDYFAPILVLWNADVNGKPHKHGRRQP